MIDLTGQKLGMITVLSKSDVTSAKKLVRWNCVCDCGRTFVSTGSGLISVEDRIADAVSLLKLYAPHLLANDVAISEFFVTKETDEVPS